MKSEPQTARPLNQTSGHEQRNKHESNLGKSTKIHSTTVADDTSPKHRGDHCHTVLVANVKKSSGK